MNTQEVIQIYSDTNKYAYIGEQLLYLKRIHIRVELCETVYQVQRALLCCQEESRLQKWARQL